jgi:general secretion pathway protein L
MSESLVIRLDDTTQDLASWVAVDATGALVSQPAEGTLADAALAAVGRQVIALFPALNILRIRAEVPVKAGAKLLQMLPFALEEQVAEDVDGLHFAAGARDAEGRVPVAVVRRKAMNEWTQRFSAAGLTPARAYAESDAVGGMPNTTTLLLQPDSGVLVDEDGEQVPFDIASIEAVLELWYNRHNAEEERPPLHLVVYGAPERLAEYQELWESLRSRLASLEARALPEGALARLAAQIVTTPGVNLLQGEYAQRSSFASFWAPWRLSTALLGALLVLVTTVSLLDLRRTRAEAAALDQAIDQAFHYVFPHAGPINDARSELSARLQQLGAQGSGGSHEFLDMLRVVSQAVSSAGKVRIEGASYRVGALELRVQAPNVEALDRIQQGIAQSGSLQAQIQSANASGDAVIGRLQITRAGR